MRKNTVNKYYIYARSKRSVDLSSIMIALLILLGTAFNASGAIEVSSVDLRGNIATGNAVWDARTFSGFFYDVDEEIGTETLTIGLSGSDGRTIAENNMTYSTTGQEKMLKLVDAKFGGDGNAAASAGLERFGAGDMAATSGHYTIIGWMGGKYVAIRAKDNKLSKLLLEHGTSTEEKKTITIGETWDLGGGYTLIANSIDAKASPRQVWLTLSKDGKKKEDKVITAGTADSNPIYTYVESSLCGEPDVPVFVTYVDSIFAGATTDMVQFRYTWVISPSCTEVQTGNLFGSLKVTSTNSPLVMKNSDTTLTLSQGSTVDIAEGIKLKVADNATLRYYPYINRTSPGEYEARGNTATGSASWNAQTYSGFFYDLNDNSGKETLDIITSGSNNRVIAENALTYSTQGESRYLKVVQHQFNSNANAAIAAGLQQFGAGNMGNLAGQYNIVGWQGEKFVRIKNKPNKLSRLVIEHGNSSSDRKTMTVGETWNVGGGWSLKVNSTNMLSNPKRAQLILKYNGIIKNQSYINEGRIYTYVEKNLTNETNVPLFVTYVDSIFSNGTANIVQLRYTWALSRSVTEIKAGDTYGFLKVTTTDPLILKNSDRTLILSRDAVVDLEGELKLRVADSETLRYYPFIGFKIPEPPIEIIIEQPFNTLVFKPKNWSLVSVPRALKNASIDAAFKNLSGDSKNAVWQLNSTSRNWERPSKIIPLMSYWVYNNASVQKTQKLEFRPNIGLITPQYISLRSGWNLIGHSSLNAMPVSSALVSIDEKYSNLLSYDNANVWRRYITGNSDQQQFNIFEPGRGYWIFMKEDATYAAIDI